MSKRKQPALDVRTLRWVARHLVEDAVLIEELANDPGHLSANESNEQLAVAQFARHRARVIRREARRLVGLVARKRAPR
jgi:hypothetical protein